MSSFKSVGKQRRTEFVLGLELIAAGRYGHGGLSTCARPHNLHVVNILRQEPIDIRLESSDAGLPSAIASRLGGLASS
ncbi:hypothetical protein KXX32_001865 [Aspergillus fumigatus]|nr:hypothetical protein KXX32_001865 [Aspergillus fumigatus]